MLALVCVALVLVARRIPGEPGIRWLAHRRAPAVFGVASALVVWGLVHWSADPVAVYHDEAAYQLQGSLFAHLRWTEPAPADPTPFRQMYVLDSVRIASKYPPGHSLALATGYLVGVPFLAPLLLTALSGGLVFALGRAWVTPLAGLVAWLAWVSTWGTARWHTTWFSETTSGPLMLLGWWLLPRVQDDRRAALALGAVTGWLAITRPLTAVVFVVPIAIHLLRHAWRRRSIRAIALATLAGLPLVALWPVWSLRTTGDAARSPLEQYTAQHLPWDRMGFGVHPEAPTVVLRDEQAGMEGFMRELHGAHTPGRYVPHLLEHAVAFLRERAPAHITVLLAVAVLGVMALPWWTTVAAGLQFLAYGLYAHPREWTLYYAELGPLVAIAVAAGAMVAARRTRLASPQAVLCALAGLLALWGAGSWPEHAARLRARGTTVRHFREAIAPLAPGAVVFVRYPPNPSPHVSLVTNLAPRAERPVLVAYDRGHAANRELAARLDRRGWTYDLATGSLTPLDGEDTGGGSATAPTAP
jgi:hypothetical protein